MLQEKITYVTGNAEKARQMLEYIKLDVTHVDIDLPEIQSDDVGEVARFKAIAAYQQVQQPVVVEDFSVCFEAFNGFPGPLIKWYTKAFTATNICEQLVGKDRRAIVEAAVAYAQGEDEVRVFVSRQSGVIDSAPRLPSTFVVESIFIPDGYAQTWSQMSEADVLASSVRVQAFRQLAKYLEEQ